MIVQCPDCNSRYQLDPDRVPRRRIRARCPNCRYVFGVDGTLAGQEVVTASGVSKAVPPVGAPSREVMIERTRPSASVPVAPVAPSAPAPVAGPGFDLEIERHNVGAPRPAAQPSRLPEHEVEVPAPAAPAAVAVAPVPVARPAATVAPSADENATTSEKKARRLARALVSDILVYNRELRDKALAEGTLVQSLGHEIKKSYELFKERAGTDIQNPRQHFVEALNDILADGQKVF